MAQAIVPACAMIACRRPNAGALACRMHQSHGEVMMSIIDNVVEANREYAKRHDRKLAQHPAPKIAVVTCMDPRLSNLTELLGLPRADIDVIRTGGPAVTEDVLAELVVSTRVLGSKEIMLLNLFGCGFSFFLVVVL